MPLSVERMWFHTAIYVTTYAKNLKPWMQLSLRNLVNAENWKEQNHAESHAIHAFYDSGFGSALVVTVCALLQIAQPFDPESCRSLHFAHHSLSAGSRLPQWVVMLARSSCLENDGCRDSPQLKAKQELGVCNKSKGRTMEAKTNSQNNFDVW